MSKLIAAAAGDLDKDNNILPEMLSFKDYELDQMEGLVDSIFETIDGIIDAGNILSASEEPLTDTESTLIRGLLQESSGEFGLVSNLPGTIDMSAFEKGASHEQYMAGIEGFGTTIKDLFEMIKKFLLDLIEKTIKFVKNNFGQLGRLKKRLKKEIENFKKLGNAPPIDSSSTITISHNKAPIFFSDSGHIKNPSKLLDEVGNSIKFIKDFQNYNKLREEGLVDLSKLLDGYTSDKYFEVADDIEDALVSLLADPKLYTFQYSPSPTKDVSGVDVFTTSYHLGGLRFIISNEDIDYVKHIMKTGDLSQDRLKFAIGVVSTEVPKEAEVEYVMTDLKKGLVIDLMQKAIDYIDEVEKLSDFAKQSKNTKKALENYSELVKNMSDDKFKNSDRTKTIVRAHSKFIKTIVSTQIRSVKVISANTYNVANGIAFVAGEMARITAVGAQAK